MVRNVADSIRAKLASKAKQDGIDTQSYYKRWMMEAFLRRLSVSPYRDRIILKGGLMFAVWSKGLSRATYDVDLNMDEADTDRVVPILQEICSTAPDVDDGVVFDAASAKWDPLTGSTGIPGGRVKFNARLGTADLPVVIDVGFGNAITPAPMVERFPSVLPDLRSIVLLVYPRRRPSRRSSPSWSSSAWTTPVYETSTTSGG